ncbi:HAMP domain-containing sensor histidine kinase [Culicoidibacter larvae]|nr:HAMP domain-containing sensor histidine kinase [Culicoidibacter larvae]
MLNRITTKIVSRLFAAFAIILFLIMLATIFIDLSLKNTQFSQMETVMNEYKDDVTESNLPSQILGIKNGVLFLFQNNQSMHSLNVSQYIATDWQTIDGVTEKEIVASNTGDPFSYIYILKQPQATGTLIGLKLVNATFFGNSDIYRYLLIILLFLIVFVTPIILWSGYQISKPIIKLKKDALAVANGDYNRSFTLKTHDEIEELSNAMEYMKKQLENKQELQQEFIAGISHDFKTPLAVIESSIEVLADNLVSEDEQAEYYNVITNEIKRLDTLVNTILDLSMMQEGLYTFHYAPLSLDNILMTTIESVQILAQEKGVTLRFNTDNQYRIIADETAITRVFYNFLDNAIKHSPKNSNVEINVSSSHKTLTIQFTNYGDPLTAEEKDNIWNQYYKSNKSSGSGLGLAIAKYIMDNHEFTYDVFSNKKATTFSIHIPEAKYTNKKTP